MKIAAYEVRPDEKPVIEERCNELGIELVTTSDVLNAKTVEMSKGCDGVTMLGQSDMGHSTIDALVENDVQVVAFRCVGWDTIDVDYARSKGLKITHGSYAPNGVAEYTVMGILMCIRKAKKAMMNTSNNDFTLKGKMARELRTMTVGVIGAGKIGYTVIKILSGFGCRILAYDIFKRDDVAELATYVDLDTLYRESDIITLHTNLSPGSERLINRDAISKMKDGVILINNARGGLVDIDALIEGIETEKIGALFMDAFAGEEGIIHLTHDNDIIRTPGMPYFKLKYLRSFVNVIHTPHMAFFTEEAAESMALSGVDGIYEVLTNGTSAHEIPQ
jgi:lactate dehydrogenase-like 2-hydroxyacid dehydrogenase